MRGSGGKAPKGGGDVYKRQGQGKPEQPEQPFNAKGANETQRAQTFFVFLGT